jgi:hypothetical protein
LIQTLSALIRYTNQRLAETTTETASAAVTVNGLNRLGLELTPIAETLTFGPLRYRLKFTSILLDSGFLFPAVT